MFIILTFCKNSDTINGPFLLTLFKKIFSMVKYFLALTSLCFILIQVSCDEVPPFIDLEEPDKTLIDTSYIITDIPAAQEKIMVIEDFSGVACVNCPKGNATVQDLIEEYDGRVIGMTLHAGTFAKPRAQNVDTFAIPETEDLAIFLNIQGYPAATIDRFEFESGLSTSITSTWPVLTAERATATTPLNIELQNSFNEEDNQLIANVKVTYLEEMAGETHNISIFLLESGIIDLQDISDPDVPSGKIPDYEHNHVVRDMLTPAQGTLLSSEAIVPGLVVEREFALTLKSKWNPENMEVVAFVHKSGDSKEIIQAVEEHVK